MRARVGFGKPPVPFESKKAVLVPEVLDGAVSVQAAERMPAEMDLPYGDTPGLTRKMRLLHRFEAVETHRVSKGAIYRVKAFETLAEAQGWLKDGLSKAERDFREARPDHWANKMHRHPPVPYSTGWVRWVRAAPVYADAMLLNAVAEAAERISERA